MRAILSLEGALVLGAAAVTSVLTRRVEPLYAGAAVFALLAYARSHEAPLASAPSRAGRDGLSPRLLALGRQVDDAAAALALELEGSPDAIRRAHGRTGERALALAGLSDALLRRVGDLERRLGAEDPCQLATERDRLRARERETNDGSWTRAADAIDASLADHAGLVCEARRLEAQHAAIAAALERARATVVRARLGDPRAADGAPLAAALAKLERETAALA